MCIKVLSRDMQIPCPSWIFKPWKSFSLLPSECRSGCSLDCVKLTLDAFLFSDWSFPKVQGLKKACFLQRFYSFTWSLKWFWATYWRLMSNCITRYSVVTWWKLATPEHEYMRLTAVGAFQGKSPQQADGDDKALNSDEVSPFQHTHPRQDRYISLIFAASKDLDFMTVLSSLYFCLPLVFVLIEIYFLPYPIKHRIQVKPFYLHGFHSRNPCGMPKTVLHQIHLKTNMFL